MESGVFMSFRGFARLIAVLSAFFLLALLLVATFGHSTSSTHDLRSQPPACTQNVVPTTRR